MPKLELSDISLHYEDIGEGKPLVLLHGLGSSIDDWKNQVPFFSKNYRVVTIDLRAHGKTSNPKEDYGVKFMTQDVKQLMDYLEINNATIVGFSMGGAIAFQMAVSYPEYVDKLVIVNSSPDFNNMGKIGEDMISHRLEFLKTHGMKSLAEEISFNMFPEIHQVELRKTFETRCSKNDLEAYKKSFLTLMSWGLGSDLSKINAKTLVIASDMDYTPVEFKQEYVSRLNQAELKIIKNSRHGVVMDQPESFNETLIEFLKS